MVFPHHWGKMIKHQFLFFWFKGIAAFIFHDNEHYATFVDD